MNDNFISSQSFPSRQTGSSIILASLKSINESSFFKGVYLQQFMNIPKVFLAATS